MVKSSSDKKFNEGFWAFVYLVISDDTLLSENGKILREIVQSGGYYPSVSEMARSFKLQKPEASRICCELTNKGYITMVKYGNKKIIKFNEAIITKALKIPHSSLGDKENGY